MARDIVLDGLAGRAVEVYLFGSFSQAEDTHASDIDIAVLPLEPLDRSVLREIRARLEQSTIPRDVDLVDLREVSEDFRERVRREGISWTGPGSE